MYSKAHFVISIAVGALVTVAVGVDGWTAGLFVAYAGVLGVAIDVDHFLIARLNGGDWRAVSACLRDPSIVVADQSAIFRPAEVSELERLLSHHVIGGVLVVGIAPVSVDLALVTGAVLYAHVLSDLVWDIRRRGDRSDGPVPG